MRIAITGSSGLVGSALRRHFESGGHAVLPVTRRRERARADAPYWNPDANEMDAASFEGVDVVVHLAGESLFGVWTKGRKARIRRSRAEGTRLLAEGLASLARPPRVLVSASGVNYYAPRSANVPLDESAPAGDGFLAEVVRAWEAGTQPAERAGIRTAQLRFGLVIAREGGIVQKMLPPFRLGLGAIVGPGDQAWSWIALADLPAIIDHVIATPQLRGGINTTAPNAVTSREFSQTLGRVLNRPVPLRIPASAVALLPGGMGRELAIQSTNVVPKRLLDSGYPFRFTHLEPALRHVLAAR
ncbi:MAG TPA: TIGR01777 family oxidoreductase [Longimicrobiales bacterium]